MANAQEIRREQLVAEHKEQMKIVDQLYLKVNFYQYHGLNKIVRNYISLFSTKISKSYNIRCIICLSSANKRIRVQCSKWDRDAGATDWRVRATNIFRLSWAKTGVKNAMIKKRFTIKPFSYYQGKHVVAEQRSLQISKFWSSNWTSFEKTCVQRAKIFRWRWNVKFIDDRFLLVISFRCKFLGWFIQHFSWMIGEKINNDVYLN